MDFTREQFDDLCARTHRIGELAHLEIGFAQPELLLVAPNLTVEALLLPGGIPGAEGTAWLRRRAAVLGAVAAAYTSESWFGRVSVPPSEFTRLAPQDLPLAADLPDRLEVVATSAVWPAGGAVAHRLTVITRTPLGSVLGPPRPFKARDYGTNRWLASLIAPTPP